MNDRAAAILGSLYLPDAIYLSGVNIYSAEGKTILGAFVVPASCSYTRQPIEYVTAEQYIRCLSQLVYVLVGFLIQDGIADFDFTNPETFHRLMIEGRMWFRRSDLRYASRTSKETEFELTLTLRQTGTRGAFCFCTLEVDGAVRGELEFVAPLVRSWM